MDFNGTSKVSGLNDTPNFGRLRLTQFLHGEEHTRQSSLPLRPYTSGMDGLVDEMCADAGT
jgi:hypothetical protein